MFILELFAGTRSIGKVAEEEGHDVFSVDIEQHGGIHLVKDILQLQRSDIPGIPGGIWASPPCTSFSIASIGKHWNKDGNEWSPKSKTAEIGILLLRKTIDIISWYPDVVWAFENPRGGMRKMPEVAHLHRHTVTYCKYGFDYMKPTDIWTNLRSFVPRQMCSNGDSCHESAPRGSRKGVQGLEGAKERGRIPYELCRMIIQSMEQDVLLKRTLVAQ